MAAVNINRTIYANMWREDIVGGVKTMNLISTTGFSGRIHIVKDYHITPDYFQRLKSKQRLPILPYSLYREIVKNPCGDPYRIYTYIPNGDKSVYYGPDPNGYGVVSYHEPSSFSKANQRNALNNNLLTKVKAEYVNLGNFIAERKQAIDMLGSSMKKLANTMFALKKGNLPAAARYLTGKTNPRLSAKKTIANNWLELQYGWLPLLSDCYGVSEALAGWPERNRLPITTVRKTQKLTDNDFVYVKPMNYTREYEWKISSGVSFTVDQAYQNYLSRIGLTNPLSIAWEVTPFSFVVDWFFPIGKFLGTLDATVGLSFVDGYLNEKLSSRIDAAGDAKVHTSYPFTDLTFSRGSTSLLTFSRTPLTGFPQVSLPQLRNPLSAQHCANALALLTQAFKR